MRSNDLISEATFDPEFIMNYYPTVPTPIMCACVLNII